MHDFIRTLTAAIITGAMAIALPLSAQTMDVEQADTIDFQSFHTDKKEAIKAWDKKTTTKAYTGESGAESKAPAKTAATQGEAAVKPSAVAATSTESAKGKRFEIRERYTLTRSAQTPYSAFYVIEPLYKQAAQLCAKGWKKIGERSEPVEQDFYLYYEIECL